MIEAEDLLRFQFVDDVQLSPDGRRLAYVQIGLEADAARPRIYLQFTHENDGGRFLTEGASPRWSPDGRLLSYVRDGRVYVTPTEYVAPRRLTDFEGGPATWSPDGRRLLFTAPAPLPDACAPRVLQRGWHKVDGQGAIRPTCLYVCAIDGTPVRITEGHDITPCWSPDGARIAFTRMRTDCFGFTPSDIWTCDADGSNARQVTHGVTRAKCPTWSPDGRTLAFYGVESDVNLFGDPFVLLWRVEATGPGSPHKIEIPHGVGYTPPLVVETGPQWNGTCVIVPVTNHGNVHLASVDTDTGAFQLAVEGARQVSAYSFAAGRLAFVAGQPRDPSDVYLDGTRMTHVNARTRDLLPPVEQRTFDGPNGALQGWLYGDLTAGRGTRPLLIDIHGGPHSFVGNGFAGGHFYRYVMASKGWVVLALDPSGSGSYGADFARRIRGGWGERDMPEQLAAVDALIAGGLVNADRLAISGYSYGGYMTCWMVGHTDRFKVAVAGGCVSNLESFHGTSDIGPWFMHYQIEGPLAATRETYRRLSPVRYADRIRTPLLLLHGEDDDRCPIGQSEEMFSALLAAGNVKTEFVRYPKASHLFIYMGRPAYRVDYCKRLVGWITRYIPSPFP